MPDEGPKNPPRWSRRPEARREEILAAAALVFSEMGFVRAALSDVAKRAGISAGTVHHYFGSKEALFEELVRCKVETFNGIEALIVEHRGSVADALKAVLEHLARVTRERPAACLGAVIRSEAASLPRAAKILMDQVGGRLGQLLQSLIESGVRSGEFRAVDPEAVSQVIMPSLMGVIQDYHTVGTLMRREPATLDRQLDAWFSLIFEGLLAKPEPSTPDRC